MTTSRDLADTLDKGDAAEFQRLLSTNAVLLRDHDGTCRWLFHAAQLGKLDIAKFLVGLGADVNEKDPNLGDRPILMAASEGHLEVVRFLLDQGAIINEVKKDGVNWCGTLNAAIMAGRLEVVKLLVERGANINAIGPGRTPLSFALGSGKKEIAEYLRSKGAKLPEELSPEERGPAKPAQDDKKKFKKK
jgi:hypothetical protein